MIKNICCIGAGYVGGPTMAVIAEKCPDITITLVDSNPDKIAAWNGPLDKLPVYEPGLKEIVEKVRDKNLFFSNEIKKNIDNSEMIFIAVNTPTKTSGEGAGMAADLKYVIACAKEIAKSSNSDKIVIEKSTLPVRTAEKIKEILYNEGKSEVNFEILSNPEFLAEGTAISDLYKSDRVLIGGDETITGQNAVNELVSIYERWIPKTKILTTNVWSSELAKLASNAMLAQRISSINSLSALCEKTDANIDEVSKAIGMDKRIGPKFLKVSPGFGGSCFKKDILNLVYLCKHYDLNEIANYWESVIKINEFQRSRIFNIVSNYIKKSNIEQEVSILGWAFKKNTNDTRESPSIYVAGQFLKNDFKINIYDPKVKQDQIIVDLLSIGFKSDQLNKKIKFYNSLDHIIDEKLPILIMTEWDEFKKINNKISSVFDFRNILDKANVTYRF
tara:strand:- start:15331 stop:16668 length:1338 start_codon:yes stop_codon:yes gene_type:complete